MIISIQGMAGSFHEQAARQKFGDKVELLHRPTFEEVFDDLYSKRADHIIVAYQNSQYGMIYEVDDLLKKFDPTVIDEISLEVSFCLLAPKGARLEEIKEVYSQTPAIVQCDKFLREKLTNARAIEHYDTAGAAADVAKWNDTSKAALASKLAGQIYGLDVLADRVEDEVGANKTKFYLLKR